MYLCRKFHYSMGERVASYLDIKSFLEEFLIKADHFGIFYVDSKPNNIDTLAELEITPDEREKYVKSLKPEDYCKGPLTNDYPNQNDVWVFGKMIKTKEIYIKIYIGKNKSPCVCISFHTAKYKLKYPLKNK